MSRLWGRSLRAVLAGVAWWGGVALSLALAAAVLGRALRADGEGLPWAWFFKVAGWLSPEALVDLVGQQTGLTGITLDMAVWSFVSLAVLAVALAMALLARPGVGGRRST